MCWLQIAIAAIVPTETFRLFNRAGKKKSCYHCRFCCDRSLISLGLMVCDKFWDGRCLSLRTASEFVTKVFFSFLSFCVPHFILFFVWYIKPDKRLATRSINALPMSPCPCFFDRITATLRYFLP